MKKSLFLTSLLSVVLVACQPANEAQNTQGQTPVKSEQSSAEQTFAALLDKHWNWQLKGSPTFATSLGVRDYDDQLSDPSLAAYDKNIETAKSFLAELNDISRADLSEGDQLNARLLQLDLENQIAGSAFGGKYMFMTNRNGPHTNMAGLPNRLPFFKAADYHSYLARLTKMPAYFDKATDRLRAGIEAGWVQPCAPMEGFETSIQTHIVDDVNDSNFLRPFKKKPASMNQQAFDAAREKAKAEVEANIIPALKTFEKFYLEEYAPACRAEVGTSSMPGGAEYYAHRVKMFTTTDRTPDEVHNIGLSEVARIRAEMDEVQKQAGFEGTFKEFQNHLRTSPEFYPKTAKERMDAAAIILKKMDGKLPELFTKFPRMPYGLKEIPLDIAEKTTTAYYLSLIHI